MTYVQLLICVRDLADLVGSKGKDQHGDVKLERSAARPDVVRSWAHATLVVEN